MIHSFRLLHLRRFFEHRFRTFLSIAGVAIGAALAVAVLGLFGSMDESVNGFVEDLAGPADLEVSAVSTQGFDQKILFAVEDTDGVAAAVPMIRTPVEINGRRAHMVGLDQRAQALRTQLSRQQAANLGARSAEPGVFVGKPLAESLKVAEGDRVKVFSAAGEMEVKVTGVLAGETARFNQGLFAAAALPLAQHLAGKQGKLDSIWVVAEPRAGIPALVRRLSQIAGASANVDSPGQRTEQAALATRQIRTSMLLGVAMAVVVGGFLIFITMNMAATERRRELATLRALGGRRGPLLGMFLLEAAALGLVGSVLGSLLGYAAARRLVEQVPPFLAQAIGVELGFHFPPYGFPAALAASVAASVIAAIVPTRRALGVSPVESMRPEGVLETAEGAERIAPVPTAIGAALLGGGLLFSVAGPPAWRFLGLAGILMGILAASNGLTAPITRITASLAGLLGVAGRLGAAALQRAPRRAWATSAAVLLATGLTAGQRAIQVNVETSVERNLGSLGDVDFWVSAPGSASGIAADIHLPGDWEDDLAGIPGVARVGTNTFTFITYRGQKVLLQALSGEASISIAPALFGSSDEVRRMFVSGDGVAVSTRFSDLFGVEVGETLELPTPTGLHRIEIVHSAPSFAWERGLVTIPRSLLIQWFGHTGVGDYAVGLRRGANPEAVRSEVEKFVAAAPIDVDVYSGAESVEFIRGSVDQLTALFRAMSWVVLAAAALAILNSLLISVVERRRELGIMRALGTAKKQLRRMVGLEAASIGVVGGVIGAGIGFLVHRTALAAIRAQSGFPLDYEFVAWPAGVAFALGVAIALAGSILPARRAGAVNIIEAIGYE